jgi:hypothetical protein
MDNFTLQINFFLLLFSIFFRNPLGGADGWRSPVLADAHVYNDH